MLKDVIPPEAIEVINFISDKESLYQKEVSDKVKKEVQEKYGESGLKIFNELNEPSKEFDGEECPDCGSSEEILNDINEEEGSPIPDFIMDQIACSIIEKNSEMGIMYCTDILSSVKMIYPEYLDFINKSDIEQICKIICFKGISDGWLIDKMFDLDDMPKEIQERSVEGDEISKREIELAEKEDKNE